MPQLMPVNQIVIPTDKWQVTIPKKIRNSVALEKKTPLNVRSDNGEIIFTPIKMIAKEDVWTEERRKKLLKALQEAKGMWADDWLKIKKRLEKQRRAEINAVKKMKNAW